MRRLVCALLLVLGGTLGSNLVLAGPEEPKITIRHEVSKTFYEYRVNGVLVEIKVVPEKGVPYYLVPAENGDGAFIQEDESQLLVPKWVIFSW